MDKKRKISRRKSKNSESTTIPLSQSYLSTQYSPQNNKNSWRRTFMQHLASPLKNNKTETSRNYIKPSEYKTIS